MSLRKAIMYGKEHRKPYRGAKDVDRTCRNHGSCPWCQENRNYKNLKRKDAMNDREEDFFIEYYSYFRDYDQ